MAISSLVSADSPDKFYVINSPWKYFSCYFNGSNVLIALGSTLVFSVASFPTAYAMTILSEHPFFQIFDPGTDFWVEVEVGGLGQVFFELLKFLFHGLSNVIWHDYA